MRSHWSDVEQLEAELAEARELLEFYRLDNARLRAERDRALTAAGWSRANADRVLCADSAGETYES